MLAPVATRGQTDRDRVVAMFRALDAAYRGKTSWVADVRVALGDWRVITDIVACRAGVGPDHPDAVFLPGGQWVIITRAPWAAGLPNWP
jgi:hypothetical protein